MADGDAGLASGEESPKLSMESSAVLPTLPGAQQEGGQEDEPLSSSAPAPEVLPTPQPDGELTILGGQIDDVSTRLSRVISLLQADTHDDSSPQRSSPASSTSTTASGVPAADYPEGSHPSDLCAATDAITEVRKEAEALARGAIAGGEGAAGGDSRPVPPVACVTHENGKTRTPRRVIEIGEVAGQGGVPGSVFMTTEQGQLASGRGRSWRKGGDSVVAKGDADAVQLWGTGVYAAVPAPLVSHAMREEPATTIIGAMVRSAGGSTTATGGAVDGLLDSDTVRYPGEISVPLAEAAADPWKGALEDHGIQDLSLIHI